jgi:AAA family ATP:ADP antiporter
VILLGSIHVICSLGIKYTLFGPNKELAYMSLNANLRDQGKATVDMIGERTGKTLSAFLQSSLLMLIPGLTYELLTPIFFCIFIFVLIIWIVTIHFLNKEQLRVSNQ